MEIQTARPRAALAFREQTRSEPYRRALALAGVEAVPFTPDEPGSLDDVAALVLTGGDDVDPALYAAVRMPETEPADHVRDAYEADLLHSALTRGMPVLAICRGLQLLNVVRGGTLIQHLPDTKKHQQRTGARPVHDVTLTGSSISMYGYERMPVNSRHHQAIDRLGEGLVVTARDPDDGVIEGIELPGTFFVAGVQWHPEDMADDPVQIRLFLKLADIMKSCP